MSIVEQLQRAGLKHGTKFSVLLLLDLLDIVHKQRMEAIEQHEHRTVRATQ